MTMQESHDRVQWVYGSTSNQELEERYDQWASEYDKDLDEVFVWTAPETGAGVLARLVPADAAVLDAGAGTGLVGKCLADAGFTNMTAMDLSQGMLEEARSKNVYTSFHQMTLGETLGFETGQFDAVISIGVFTLGHAPVNSFDELVRVTKSGGYIVFSLRVDMVDDGFQEFFDGLESAGKWKLAEVSEPYQPLPKGEPEVFHQIWAYQVSWDNDPAGLAIGRGGTTPSMDRGAGEDGHDVDATRRQVLSSRHRNGAGALGGAPDGLRRRTAHR